jgi:hypothetical protein
MNTLSQSTLEAALAGLEAQRNRNDEHIAAIRSLLGNRGTVRRSRNGASAAPSALRRARRPLSAAARKRISDAQRKRWATLRKNQ